MSVCLSCRIFLLHSSTYLRLSFSLYLFYLFITLDTQFCVVDYDRDIGPGWKLADISTVQTNMEEVQRVLEDKTWHICALSDGRVGGPGYSFEIKHEVEELGHKLIIRGIIYLQSLIIHLLNTARVSIQKTLNTAITMQLQHFMLSSP